MATWCWGFGWGDDAIDAKTRSLMNLSMIGALNNGVTLEEIRATCHVIAIYCGVSQGVECFREARVVLEAEGLL